MGLAHALDDTQLVLSELVTNALQAGAGSIIAMLGWYRGARLVEVLVWDDGPGLPEPQGADLDAAGGRGLLLVEALAAAWGHRPGAEGGKVTWARLDL